jgi:Selenophosphate synthase
MTQLNKAGALLSSLPGVHAMTDVTGFGLLGHLIEMAEGSGLGAELNYASIPVIEEAKTYLAQRIVPDATYRNWNSYSTKVGFETGVNVMEAFNLLPDPQTNGGLLIAASADAVEEIQKINGDAVIIGKLIPAGEKLIKILP